MQRTETKRPHDEPEDRPQDGPPFDGDPAWRVARTLLDGTTIALRPIVPEDREELRRRFRETSERTRYLRFFGVVGEPSEQMLDYLTRVDQKDHVAIVATVPSPDLKTERGIGVGRFVRLPESPDVAEAAITVVDDMQRKGVGTELARELARAAKVRGIRHLRAEVLASNDAMRAILDAAGAKPVRPADPEHETIGYDFELTEDVAPEAPGWRRVLDVLRGAAETMALTIRRLVPPEDAATATEDGERDEADR